MFTNKSYSLLFFAFGCCALFLYFWIFDNSSPATMPEREVRHYEEILIDGKKISFDLLDPELAPPEIKEQVMLGFRIISETKKYAPDYVGNRITCNNCHFCAGNTLGGKNGGISLLNSPKTYPRYSTREGKIITLKDRINNCFERSLNGKSLPFDSPEMDAIIAYLNWISLEVSHIKSPPWLGLNILQVHHEANAERGVHLYLEHCAICHRPDGNGTTGVPPLWGQDSFNQAAGMNTLPLLSSFIYYNMPHQEPNLTPEEALDVAAFVIQQNRPKFIDEDQKNE